MRDHLHFHLNGRPVRVGGDDAFLALSDLLRRRERLTGTKVVCAEGDCGSCCVLVGRRGDGGSFRYATVTSCITQAFQLDGTHVVTVEGLSDGDALNPIQREMVACHGAQCGFCTPGFVASLQQMVEDGTPMTRDAATRALVGNLCRCTGYDAILRAATRVDPASVTRLESRYPSASLNGHASISDDGDGVLIETPTGRRAFVPTTLASALAHRVANPTATIVAGATDVGVLVNKRVRAVTDVLVLNGVRELREVRVEAGALVVGAAATLTDLERAALEHLPELGRFLAWFGSPPIKNAGTLGGNLATGSPIGDSIPALMVLGASVELSSIHLPSPGTPGEGRGVRAERAEGRTADASTIRVPRPVSDPDGPHPRPLSHEYAGEGRAEVRGRTVGLDAFYTGYRQSVMRPDELITAIRIPLLRDGERLKLYKVSKRRDLDISTVSAAILLRLDEDQIADARIALGGVGPTVVRVATAEDALRGKPFAIDSFDAAAAAVRDVVTPISDVRGSAGYRRAVAANLMLRCFHELDAERREVTA